MNKKSIYQKEVWEFDNSIKKENINNNSTNIIAGSRPVLIISNYTINSAAEYCIMMPLTRGNHTYKYKYPLVFDGKEGFVIYDQIQTVDQYKLIKRLGKIDSNDFAKIMTVLPNLFK